jgi:hypothetical protein
LAVVDLQEQAIWGIGNIAGDSIPTRNLVLEAGALAPILQCVTVSSTLSLQRNGCWTISNLCRGKPPPVWENVAPACPLLARLLFHTDDEILTDACWALSYLSDINIQGVIEVGIARRIVELTMHKSQVVVVPALRTVGNIVSGDDLQTQVMLNVGALPCLVALLNSPKKSIRKEATWALSNITAGSSNQIQAIIDSGVIPSLLVLLSNSEMEIKKEALWAIANATSGGTKAQLDYLVNQGCLPPLAAMLSVSDTRLIVVSLEAIASLLNALPDHQPPLTEMLEEIGALDTLESLQSHESNEVYNKALQILERHFAAEDL